MRIVICGLQKLQEMHGTNGFIQRLSYLLKYISLAESANVSVSGRSLCILFLVYEICTFADLFNKLIAGMLHLTQERVMQVCSGCLSFIISLMSTNCTGNKSGDINTQAILAC